MNELNYKLEGMWKETVLSYLKISLLCQDGLRKHTKILSYDSQYPGRDSNLIPPDYKPEEFPPEPPCTV